jgi:hypothetical protein
VKLQTARRFWRGTRELQREVAAGIPVPENGRLKSGYYCRLSGELSNRAQLAEVRIKAGALFIRIVTSAEGFNFS